MRVNGSHLADLEVTQRDPRERLRRCPLRTRDQVADDRDAVHVIVGAEERVQYEQLAHHVREVQYLREHVESHQVVPVAVAAYQTHVLGDEVLYDDATSAAVLALVVQVVIEVADHVLDRLVASFRV